jgi:hypothetical protein
MNDDAIAALVEQYREWLGANGLGILAGDRVNESAAAALLDLSPRTLRNYRSARIGPTYIKRRRVSYCLRAIAEWELSRE